MKAGDGILGIRDGERARVSVASTKKKWLKRRERWLVILGVVLHAVYMLSIFDIYFKTPIVHGMDPATPRFSAPAKRLVLLVADGLRADKFFELDSERKFTAPFLRSVMQGQGRWGVSHARPPTESRPGHVAIIAGFHEDPSAVTKGWKANPVEFDSVFNRSRHTFAFGSPDIIPIFCGALPHSTWNSYPHEFEDFATDASFLDEWSFDQFENLLNSSTSDEKLRTLLLQDNLVIFLHLLGCDSNGHAHRPYSSIYLNSVKVVDQIAKRVYDLVENYFMDNRTAYVFTADHGMSDKGSHSDGHPTNTDTPLVVWGAGVQHPKPMISTGHENLNIRFVDENLHDAPTPVEWGLSRLERVDVNQADIAALMSTLLGLPCPMNSVGNLPLGYVDMNEAEEVEAVLANTKQILKQFLQKSSLDRFKSLQWVEVSGCGKLLRLIYCEPKLASLRVIRCARIAEVMRMGDIPQNQAYFSRLTMILLDHLPELKSICETPLPFPSLKWSIIRSSGNLRKLPFDGNNSYNKLQKIERGQERLDSLERDHPDAQNLLAPKLKIRRQEEL